MAYRFPLVKIREAFEQVNTQAQANKGKYPDAKAIAWINALYLENERDRAFWTAVQKYVANPAAYTGKTMSVAKADVIPMGLSADQAPF